MPADSATLPTGRILKSSADRSSSTSITKKPPKGRISARISNSSRTTRFSSINRAIRQENICAYGRGTELRKHFPASSRYRGLYRHHASLPVVDYRPDVRGPGDLGSGGVCLAGYLCFESRDADPAAAGIAAAGPGRAELANGRAAESDATGDSQRQHSHLDHQAAIAEPVSERAAAEAHGRRGPGHAQPGHQDPDAGAPECEQRSQNGVGLPDFVFLHRPL